MVGFEIEIHYMDWSFCFHLGLFFLFFILFYSSSPRFFRLMATIAYINEMNIKPSKTKKENSMK